MNQQLQGIVDGYTRYAPASQALTYEQLMVRAQSVTSWFFSACLYLWNSAPSCYEHAFGSQTTPDVRSLPAPLLVFFSAVLQYVNYDTDIDDIIQALDPSPDDDSTSQAVRAVTHSHCSAMVRWPRIGRFPRLRPVKHCVVVTHLRRCKQTYPPPRIRPLHCVRCACCPTTATCWWPTRPGPGWST